MSTKRIPWNKGKTNVYSKETIESISKSLSGRKLSKEHLKNREEGRLKVIKDRGFYFSSDSIKKISDSVKKTHENPTEEMIKGRERNSLATSKHIAEHRATNEDFFNTSLELLMTDILTNLGFKFEHPYYVRDIEHAYSADFYIPSLNLIIETDGKRWHNYPIGKPLDLIRNEELKQAGYKVLRFWGVNKDDYDFTLESVREAIDQHCWEPTLLC